MIDSEGSARALSLTPPIGAADRLGVNVRTLQRLVRKGTVPAPVRIPGSNRIGFYTHELDALLANLQRTREAA